jgi:hypothetical protein
MDKIRMVVFAVLLGTLFSACDNELELLAEWKDIPVVYGVLSRQDTAHYIRVEKAFLDPDKSAFELAQIPDSVYYNDNEISVQVKNMANDKVYTLERVDGTLEGYPREEGDFISQPNYLYKFKLGQGEELNEGARLQFILNRGDNKELVIAEDRVVSDMQIREPDGDGDFLFLIPESRKQDIRWRSKEDAALFNVTMIIKYKEINPADGTVEDKAINWVLTRNLPNEDGDGAEVEYTGLQFYQAIGARIDGSVQRQRIFDRVEIKVDAGAAELASYINVSQSNTGITSAEVIPNYTNLSEGYGIFSTKNTLMVKDLFLTGPSLDSLRNGRFTGDLNFQ